MRLSSILSLATLAAPLLAASETATDEQDALQPTIFNGEEVPKMMELKGDEVDQTIAKGHW